ncbi:beta-galactosidase trimerization domain-containing protein [Streptacidiphilus monticola]
MASYPDGRPALTRCGYGAGVGWYLSTELDDAGYAALIRRVLAEAGVEPVLPDLPEGAEAVVREGEDGTRWLFLLNHGDTPGTPRSPATTSSPTAPPPPLVRPSPGSLRHPPQPALVTGVGRRTLAAGSGAR